MKPIRFHLCICVMVACFGAAALQAQQRTITFSGVKQGTGAPVTLDSIRIMNLTRGRDTLLIGRNTFDIDWLSGVSAFEVDAEGFTLRGSGRTAGAEEAVFITVPRRATVRLAVHSILGVELAALSSSLEAGTHAFLFDARGIARGAYVLSASMDNITRVLAIPVLHSSSGGAARIAYAGPTATAAAPPGNASMDTYTFIGYAKASYPDTLAVVVPEPGRVYEFTFSSLPKNGMLTGPPVEVANARIPSQGGLVAVTAPGTPVTGSYIDVSPGSYSSSRDFTISYSDVLAHGFDSSVVLLSPLITISNGGGYADSAMLLKIPIRLPSGHFAMAFFYNRDTRALEGMPIVGLTKDSILVASRHFSEDEAGFRKEGAHTTAPKWVHVLVLGIRSGELMAKFSTGFTPGVDDWEFINWGSYLSPGGHCAGQAVSAIWYYVNKKTRDGAPGLHDLLDEVHADSMWMDNTQGYRFASVVQNELLWEQRDFWSRYRFNRWGTTELPHGTLQYLAFAFSIRNTGIPQYLAIYRDGAAGHAMIVYETDNGNIRIADPNYPGQTRGTRLETDQFLPYYSGDNAGNLGMAYNQFDYSALSAIVPSSGVAERWRQTEAGTIGDIPPNVFPPTELFLLKNSRPEPLPEKIETTEKELQLFATCPTCADRLPNDRTPLLLTDEHGRFVTWSDPDGILRIPVASGMKKFGVTVFGYAGTGKRDLGYIDFRWLEVTGIGYQGTYRVQCGPINARIRTEDASSGKLVISHSDEVHLNTSLGQFASGSLRNGVYYADTTIDGGFFWFRNTIRITFNDSLTVIQDFTITLVYEQTGDWTDTKTIRGGNIRINPGGSNQNYDTFLIDGPDVCPHITQYTYVDRRLDKDRARILESFTCQPTTKIVIEMRKK